MRITNKIMRNNSLYNINQNKMLEDQLSNQMTNQSKIVRPSDDPVVAIRALRLRSNVTNVSQYYDKNSPDAEQWLTVTGDALDTIDEVLEDLYKQASTASNKYLTSDDLQIILTQMESLTKEFYASGNVDYAGRFVFSGFRTDTAITFSAEDIAEMGRHPVSYEIQEEMDYADISTINYTDFDVISDGVPAGATSAESYEQFVTNNTLYRFRLSYDSVDGADASGNLPLKITDATGKDLTIKRDAAGDPVVDAGGNTQSIITEYADAEAAYKAVANGTETGIAYIPSSGELVFSEQYYKDNYKEGDNFRITYEKSSWVEGDINPVHYFKCTETKDDGTKIAYNTVKQDQDIFYDVGFNQQIQVNTVANEVFTHNVRRDMDDFQHCLKELKAIETQKSDIEKKMSEVEEGSTDYIDLQKKLEAVEKADTYIRDSIQTKFENQITKYQNYMDDTNVAITNNATRGSRLELISTRLMNQKATFKELQTNNEDIDITEVAVELSSSELTYQAALMATSKIMQTNLMNYI
ncbi:MAG: hypothetical protein PUF03_05530 [Lachnospiraceae bacterium]|nr:hypothetical protein [Lachnospiraceae bacterium]